MSVQVSFRWSEDVVEALDHYAQREGRSRSNMAERLLRAAMQATPTSVVTVRTVDADVVESLQRDAREVERGFFAGAPSPDPDLPLWVCSKCGWSKAALTPRSCPEHGIAPVEKQL